MLKFHIKMKSYNTLTRKIWCHLHHCFLYAACVEHTLGLRLRNDWACYDWSWGCFHQCLPFQPQKLLIWGGSLILHFNFLKIYCIILIMRIFSISPNRSLGITSEGSCMLHSSWHLQCHTLFLAYRRPNICWMNERWLNTRAMNWLIFVI